ncbi:MAG: SymE family type I addiction module toxin [Solobacterium sp.]|nr:SymE family type I addiction module toxin [Solobacterium sp.]
MKVCGYGTYRDADGDEVVKPQINLNAKWLAEAGFKVGDQIDVTVAENELVIRRMIISE